MEPHDVTVLIVDDEQEIRTFISDVLTTKGYRCVTAENGPEALSELSKMRPDVVLLDIMMPGMSGIEVLRQIRERDDVDPRVVMVSCLSHPNTSLRAIDEGADRFVVKPLRVGELLETLDHVLYAAE